MKGDNKEMTIEKAISILDPKTSAIAIAELEYYNGFDKEKTIAQVSEACEVACAVMKKYLANSKVENEKDDTE